jgi:HisA/HisF family protein
MEIVPVIDVRMGVAVRAVAGDRENYCPLATPHGAGAEPIAVTKGLVGLFPFRTIYVADLDGIEGRGANRPLIERLAASFPGVDVWVDDGTTVPDKSLPRTPVIGTESLTSSQSLSCGEMQGAPYVLSLDFRDGKFQGPREVLENPGAWPERVIVMTLHCVGRQMGPDLETLSGIAKRSQGRRIYAAGGVRGRDDMRALRDAGAAGALLSTALHAGKLKAGDLEEIAGF